MKCPLWPTATKLESVGTKISLLKVDQESCEWKRICQILILTLWLVILCPPCPPCFLPNTAQTVQKVTVFSWKGRGDWALILTYLDNSIAEIFPHYSQNFLISAIFRGKREVKIGPKVQTLGPSLFHKNSNPSKTFQSIFLFARALPLLGMSAKLDHTWGSMGPKT